MSSSASPHFKSICRQWRQFRNLSQLDLALAANVSQRHVSWLETGRSKPSREMVVRLSEAMEIPLRERNLLLHSAGFASAYRETDLDEPAMAPMLDALNHVLLHHESLQALVIVRFWNVRRKSKAADLLLAIDGDPEALLENVGSNGEINLALLTLHPLGLRKYISNWKQAAPAFVRRLRSEAVAAGDREVQQRFEEYIDLAGDFAGNDPSTVSLLPILPLELDINGLVLSFFL